MKFWQKSWKIFITIFSLLLVAILLSTIYVNRELRRPNSLEEVVLFEVNTKESVQSVRSRLQDAAIINKSKIDLFSIVFRFSNKKLIPGFYEIPAHASIVEVINKITSGDIKLVKVTFPEGWRTEQMAQRLEKEGIIDSASFIKVAKQYEGMLFPDTYFFNPKMTAENLTGMMVENYNNRTAGLNVTLDVLKIASIVEREAINDTERALIAGVYFNRIKKNMKLEADPTVQYGKDSNEYAKLTDDQKREFKFWAPIGIRHYLTVDSDFNTYLIKSLPPAPISNPGIKSIEAALEPEQHNYLYFLQSGGKIYPSENAAQHDYYRERVLGAKIR